MRRLFLAALLAGLVMGRSGRAHADDVRVLIDRAIRAHGGGARLEKYLAAHIKSKGVIHLAGGDVPFESEALTQLPGQIKETSQIDSGGQKMTVATVFDGDKGWVSTNGKTREMDGKVLAHMKEAAYLMQVMKLTNLKDNRVFEVSPLPEVNIEGRPALGIRVASKGRPDVRLYFDTKTGLLAKTESRTVDLQSGAEVTEERIISDYRDFDGLKSAKHLVVYRDGKQFMEAEVTEAQFLERVDPHEFAQP